MSTHPHLENQFREFQGPLLQEFPSVLAHLSARPCPRCHRKKLDAVGDGVTTVHPAPKSSVMAGIFVSAFGASCSFLLWAYKAHYGRVLRSMVLLAVSFFFFFAPFAAARCNKAITWYIRTVHVCADGGSRLTNERASAARRALAEGVFWCGMCLRGSLVWSTALHSSLGLQFFTPGARPSATTCRRCSTVVPSAPRHFLKRFIFAARLATSLSSRQQVSEQKLIPGVCL